MDEYLDLNSFNEFRKRMGLQPVKEFAPTSPSLKEGVDYEDVNPDFRSIINKASDVVGFKPTVTSGYRTQEEQDALPVAGKATISKHSSGTAADFRVNDLDQESRNKLAGYFNQFPETRAAIHGAGTDNEHLHVDYYPEKKAKQDDRPILSFTLSPYEVVEFTPEYRDWETDRKSVV